MRLRNSIIAVFSLLSLLAFGQQDYPDSGFTNVAEAKNIVINGLKVESNFNYDEYAT